MDFGADSSLARVRELGRQAGRKHAEPTLTARDRDARWDHDLFTALADDGIAAAALPLEHGGLGMTVLETVFLLEGFGAGSGDMGLSTAMAGHGVLCGLPIALLGTASQRTRYLTGMASGSRLGAVAPATVDGQAALPASAGRDGSGWLLDGRFPAVVNAPEAQHFLIIAQHGPGRTAFVVDRGAPGLTVHPEPAPAALRTCPAARLELDRCHVSADAVLGPAGTADAELVPLVAALGRTCLMAPWLGLVRELSRWSVDLLAGCPALQRSQSARMAAADLRARTELAAGLLYRAAWQLDTLSRAPRQDSAAAKLFLIEALAAAARTAAALDGYPHHRLPALCWRDLALFSAGGGSAILYSVVADSMLNTG